MGSFIWDNPGCIQYHNGRPLSSALIEPCNCQNEIQPCIQSDFAIQCRPRSQSSGRRFKRESYRVYHPNVHYASFCYSPPVQRRCMCHCGSKDFFVENFNTVLFEEERCRPKCRCVTYVRSPSPIIRQVKIRSRPSSCVNIDKQDNQWKKVVEERHDEHYDYHYNYTLPVEHSVPITRSSTRDVATETDAIQKKAIRPLSISETEVHDRYEKEEKIKRDATAETRTITYTTTAERPLCSSSYAVIERKDGDSDSDEKHYKKSSTKVQHKEFVQRMHARNGTASRTSNSFNTYSDLGKNQVVTRTIGCPRETIVEASSVIGPSVESWSSTPLNYESKKITSVIGPSVSWSSTPVNYESKKITSVIGPSVESWSSTPSNYESKTISRNYYQST